MEDNSVLKILPQRLQKMINRELKDLTKVQEIRIRSGKPLIAVLANQEYVCKYVVNSSDIREILSYISNYSLYAYEDEMRQGFITIDGGHRIGLCGQVTVEDGKIKNLKHISSMNIRMAHEVIGCAEKVFSYLITEGELAHTLIVSPPGCGKTTLLRDLIRVVSDGSEYRKGMTVGVVDERSEIGGCHRGIAQNQLGMRTDILDGCPKSEGMMMLIRSMGPEVIAVDEIGSADDVHAIEYAMHCGCKMLATVHGISIDEIRKKPVLGQIVKEQRFERYIVLGNRNGVGSVEGIYDSCGRMLFCDRSNDALGDG